MPLMNAMTPAAQEMQRNVKVGWGMQEDSSLSALQERILNVMWMSINSGYFLYSTVIDFYTLV